MSRTRLRRRCVRAVAVSRSTQTRLTLRSLGDNRDAPKPCPRIGVPIKVRSMTFNATFILTTPSQVPKTDKPGSCVRACNNLRGRVAVETKYDGERSVEILLLDKLLLTSFSIDSRSTLTWRFLDWIRSKYFRRAGGIAQQPDTCLCRQSFGPFSAGRS
jgi:hypothetical protein